MRLENKTMRALAVGLLLVFAAGMAAGCAADALDAEQARVRRMSDTELRVYHQGLQDRARGLSIQGPQCYGPGYPPDEHTESMLPPYYPGSPLQETEVRLRMVEREMKARGLGPDGSQAP